MEPGGVNRTALPPIQFLESEKYRPEDTTYQTRHTDTPKSTMTSYPTGPPPPYSASTQNGVHTPAAHINTPNTDSDLKHKDHRELIAQVSRQSLPSLSEALGVDKSASYASDLAVTAADHTSHPSAVPQSPRRTSSGPSPPHRSQPFAPLQAPYRYADQPSRSAPSDPNDHRRRDYPDNHHSSSYSRKSPVMAASQQPRHPFTPADSGRHYEASPQASVPTSQFSFGYSQPRAQYAAAPMAPPTNAGSIYQPSLSHTSPESTKAWSGASAATTSQPPQAYGDSVKRHIDLYDFELALNEISEHSTITLDFSRQYGARLHQVQRSGIAPGTLPAITEVEDLMNKSRHTLDALSRLREVLVAQQAVYFQQAQEQHLRLDEDSKRNDSVHQQDESKTGGFAGGEPKKRRGRNAAPGRCHSCNRAETPEWRRGPDGARTLCNACGLHYAKLTRKAGANKAAIGSSSLRPKGQEDDDDL